MRTYRPVVPPKDFDPRLSSILKTLDNYLRQSQSAIAALGRGEKPDQSQTIIVNQPGVTDHGALDGLVPITGGGNAVIDYNDDHTQYALLDGRPAGQYLYGSRAASVAGWTSVGTFTLYATESESSGLAYSGIATDVAAPIGTGIFLVVGTSFFDADSGGTTGETSYHSTFTDTAGNTWTKLKECSAYGGASSWRTVSIWYCLVSTAITAGTTTLGITFNTPTGGPNPQPQVNRMAIESYMFNVGAGASIEVVDSIISDQGPALEAQPDSLSLTSTGETLYFRGVCAQPFNSGPGFTSFTSTGGFSALTSNHTDSTVGGVPNDQGFSARGEFRVLSEGVTSSPTLTVDAGGYTIANILLAIQIQPGATGLLNLGAAELASTANILLTGQTIKVNADFFQWRAPGGTTTLSYIDGSDGSFHGPVVLNPAVHLLNTSLFDDVLAGTVARGSLIVGNSTPKWAALAVGSANKVLWSNGADANWTETPIIGTSIEVGEEIVPADTGIGIRLTKGDLTGPPGITIQTESNVDGYPFLSLHKDTLGTLGTMYFGWEAPGVSFGTLTADAFNIRTNAIIRLTISSAGLVTTFPTMGVNLAMGGFDITGLDDVTPNADAGTSIGTSTVGLHQVHFAQAAAAGGTNPLSTDGRGLHWIDATGGDFFVGSDNIAGTFYSQRSVKAGSTVTDYSEDATNFFQGNWGSGASPSYPWLEMNYEVGDGAVGGRSWGEDGTTYFRNGMVTIGMYNTGSGGRGGGGLFLCARGGTASNLGCGLYLTFDEANNRAVFRTMSLNSKAASSISKIAFAGTRLNAVIPVTDNAVDLGIATTNRYKGLYLSGVLDHDGTTVGFYNVTPVTRPTAYTQTYSTATRTHANVTQQTLTDSSGGTASTTLAAITGGGANCENATKNAVASLAARLAEIAADVANVKQVLNQVIDDQQSNGLFQ